MVSTMEATVAGQVCAAMARCRYGNAIALQAGHLQQIALSPRREDAHILAQGRVRRMQASGSHIAVAGTFACWSTAVPMTSTSRAWACTVSGSSHCRYASRGGCFLRMMGLVDSHHLADQGHSDVVICPSAIASGRREGVFNLGVLDDGQRRIHRHAGALYHVTGMVLCWHRDAARTGVLDRNAIMLLV